MEKGVYVPYSVLERTIKYLCFTVRYYAVKLIFLRGLKLQKLLVRQYHI
jgi:hypothetical protein